MINSKLKTMCFFFLSNQCAKLVNDVVFSVPQPPIADQWSLIIESWRTRPFPEENPNKSNHSDNNTNTPKSKQSLKQIQTFMATTNLSFPQFSLPCHHHHHLPSFCTLPTRTRLGQRIRALGHDLLGDFGARDPYPAEIASQFGEKVLGNPNTEHKILIPTGSASSLAQQECTPVSPLQLPMLEDDAQKLLRKVGFFHSDEHFHMPIWCSMKCLTQVLFFFLYYAQF